MPRRSRWFIDNKDDECAANNKVVERAFDGYDRLMSLPLEIADALVRSPDDLVTAAVEKRIGWGRRESSRSFVSPP